MDKVIVGMLTNLTFRVNDEIKIAAISALGDFKATIEYNDAIVKIQTKKWLYQRLIH